MATLTARGKRRLQLLAGLLRRHGQKFDVSRNQFYEEIQAVAEALPSEQKVHLQGIVDWLEDYEKAEVLTVAPDPSGKRRALVAKPISKPK